MTNIERKDFGSASIKMHKENHGKLSMVSKVSVQNTDDLSTAYSPGVAEVCKEIAADPSKVKDYVINGRAVAVITDGSAVLGLGNIGPRAALPVMEGKSLLFKEFADIDSFPIALDTQNTEEIITTIKNLAPSFAGINLEDISAPRCFEIEKRLKQELDIPVFHDDQHGTAIVVLAGLINAMKVTNRTIESTRVVINGSGAAGVAIAKLLNHYGFTHILLCDSKGIISKDRTDLNETKQELLKFTNANDVTGSLMNGLAQADVFIGVSVANLLSKQEITAMNEKPIVFGLANPNPEVDPEHAHEWGVEILATGRSDYPNQINNVLVFPGIFKGVLESGKSQITERMKLDAAIALADMVPNPAVDKIIPGPFDEGVVDVIAKAVSQ